MATNEDESLFLTGGPEGVVVLWQADPIKQLGKLKGMQKSESALAVALHPTKPLAFAAGTSANIYVWNTHTQQLIKKLPAVGYPVKDLFFTHGGQTLVSSSEAGRLMFWDVEKLEERFTLFITKGQKGSYNPLLISREKFYQASAGLYKAIAYRDEKNRIYPLETFDLYFNRPDKVLEEFPKDYQDTSLINSLHQAYQKRLKTMNVPDYQGKIPKDIPEVQILDKKSIKPVSLQSQVQFTIRGSCDNSPCERLHVWVNNVPLFGRKGRAITSEDNQFTIPVRLALSTGNNKIQVAVQNRQGTLSFKDFLSIKYPRVYSKPNLYLISIGVSEYQDASKNLQYAAKDAEDIANFYLDHTAFGEAHIRTLIDKEATKTNILALRDWLKSTSVDDQVILYISGHGLLDQNYDFYYATYDTDFANPSTNSILYDDIEGLLDGIPARKKLLLMDACHSGEYDKEAPPLTKAQLESLKRRGVSFKGFSKGNDESAPILGLQNSFEMMKTLFADLRWGSGATVITSSSGVQVSFEDGDWQNGAFTYTFLNGLKTMQADTNGDAQVTANEIQAYVADIVPRLTEGLQAPTFRRENLEYDFRVW